MTALDVIVQALALSEAASRAPWAVPHGDRTIVVRAALTPRECAPTLITADYPEDAEFIAAARTLLPALAKALEDVLATVEAHGEWAHFESADPDVDSWAIPTHLIHAAITAALSEVTP